MELKNTITDKVLTFGKFKGQTFDSTPKWYQEWLLKQDWFNKPKQIEQPLHQQLKGWDGHSKRGEAIYDQIFEQEKAQGDAYDKQMGFYEEGGLYYGI